MDNVLLFFIEDEFCLALLNPEELVYIMVDLVTNFLSSLKAHHNQLSILGSEQNLPEIIVLQCLLLDVSNITCHSGTSFNARLGLTTASTTGLNCILKLAHKCHEIPLLLLTEFKLKNQIEKLHRIFQREESSIM